MANGTLTLRTLGTMIAMAIAVGGIIWGLASIAHSKADVADVEKLRDEIILIREQVARLRGLVYHGRQHK